MRVFIRTRGRSYLLLVLIGMLVMGPVPIAASPPGDDGEEKLPLDSAASEDVMSDPRLVNQIPLTQASDRILRLVEQHGLTGFAGTEIDHSSRGLILFWKGRVPERIDSLVDDLRSQNIIVEARAADYSLDELNQEARRLLSLEGERVNVRMRGAGPNSDYSGLEVTVHPGDVARAEGTIQSKVPLTFEAGPEIRPVSGRWEDTMPFWGGAMVDSRISVWGAHTYCTTGFAVHMANFSQHAEAITTANHCGVRSWGTPHNNQHVGVSSEGEESVDVTLIVGTTYGPYIYTSTAYQGTHAKGVGAAANPARDSYVFASGAASGARVVRVDKVNRFELRNQTVVGPGFWTVNDNGVASVGQADSGGPVANSVNNSEIVARGTMLAMDPNTYGTCIGWQFNGRLCAWRAFHINIRAIESGLGVAVKTVGGCPLCGGT